MIPAEPGGRFSPILSCISISSRWSTNLPISPPANGAHGRGRKKRRRGKADEDADSAAPLDSLAAAVIGCLRHTHRAVHGVRDQDRGFHLDFLVLDEPGERVEILRGSVDIRVRAHQDVGHRFSHDVLSLRLRASS